MLRKKARKSGISVVKMANIQRYKMGKQGVLTERNQKQKKLQKKKEKLKTFHQYKISQKEEAERIKAALKDIYPLSSKLKGKISKFLDKLIS